MPEHPKRPRDLNQWAKHMVDLATGNATVGGPDPTKDAAAQSLGRATLCVDHSITRHYANPRRNLRQIFSIADLGLKLLDGLVQRLQLLHRDLKIAIWKAEPRAARLETSHPR